MDEKTENDGNGSSASKAIELIESRGIFFTDQCGDGFVIIGLGDHDEVMALHSKKFKSFITGEFWDYYGMALSPTVLGSVILTLDAKAHFGSSYYPLENRVREYKDAIYYDLVNSKWDVAMIDSNGWEITKPPRPLFRRYSHQKPQAIPAKSGFTLDDFLEMFHVKSEEDKLILKVWIIACFVPNIPHAVLVLYGQQGSTKSMFFKLVREIVDPSILPVLSFTSDKQELVQKLAHNYFSCFDNVSYISREQSDALCRASTGEGFSKRQLYTDEEDIIFTYKRCIGLNGINIAPQNSDLLDRSILIGFNRLTKKQRKKEKEVWAKFNEIKQGLLAYIFDTLSKAMQIKQGLDLKELPRMADFAEWGEAISQAMGNAPNAFLNAYYNNIGLQHSEAVEASLIGQALLAFIDELWPKKDNLTDCEERKQEWKGTPSKLLEELERIAEDKKINTRSRRWPKAPHILSRELNSLKTNLQELGIEVDREHTGSQRSITIRKTSVSSVKALENGESVQNTAYAGKETSVSNNSSSVSPNATHTTNNATEKQSVSPETNNSGNNSQFDATNATNAKTPTPYTKEKNSGQDLPEGEKR